MGASQYETESTIAKVTDVKKVDAGPPGQYKVMMLIWGGFGLIPIPITAQRQMKDSFIFTLRALEGHPISTQSGREFAKDQCVELRHRLTAKSEDPAYIFIPGTLKPSEKCG